MNDAYTTRMEHFADRLAAAVRSKKTPLCVGLDPRWEQLPLVLRQRHDGSTLEGVAAAYEAFCHRVLDIVAPLVGVVKPQAAFFEACGPAGFLALASLQRRARELGLVTILDAKRNDIASTAQAYADAAFAGTVVDGGRRPVWQADALTINPYLGRDAVEPFLVSARAAGAGVFVLVRTSNKGAGLFQDLMCEGKPVYEHVGAAVSAWSREHRGACGFGDVGAVVGATHPRELARLRAVMPETIFLVPGYGAQGGSAADCAAAFRDDGLGAVVNSSRGITACFKPDDPNWEKAIENATRVTNADLAAVTHLR
ncbi:MAG: orotidine-5'-phosphate decarboxylase [Gemmataceae bacterium]